MLLLGSQGSRASICRDHPWHPIAIQLPPSSSHALRTNEVNKHRPDTRPDRSINIQPLLLSTQLSIGSTCCSAISRPNTRPFRVQGIPNLPELPVLHCYGAAYCAATETGSVSALPSTWWTMLGIRKDSSRVLIETTPSPTQGQAGLAGKSSDRSTAPLLAPPAVLEPSLSTR